MQRYQKEFIDLALEVGALRFGEFKLKSGRLSPYFFNAGHFSTGRAAAQLGRFYAATIAAAELPFDMIFGPAYKGIPLAALTAAALAEHHNLDVPFAYNRKEAKNHGEGGNIVGAGLAGRVLIIDDVITAGTAVREACELISDAGAEVGGLVISLDRQERGTGRLSAVQELEDALGVAVTSIVKFEDLVESIEKSGKYDEHLEALLRYRRQYGAAPRDA